MGPIVSESIHAPCAGNTLVDGLKKLIVKDSVLSK